MPREGLRGRLAELVAVGTRWTAKPCREEGLHRAIGPNGFLSGLFIKSDLRRRGAPSGADRPAVSSQIYGPYRGASGADDMPPPVTGPRRSATTSERAVLRNALAAFGVRRSAKCIPEHRVRGFKSPPTRPLEGASGNTTSSSLWSSGAVSDPQPVRADDRPRPLPGIDREAAPVVGASWVPLPAIRLPVTAARWFPAAAICWAPVKVSGSTSDWCKRLCMP